MRRRPRIDATALMGCPQGAVWFLVSFPHEAGNPLKGAFESEEDMIQESEAPTTGESAAPRLRRSVDDRVIAGVCGGLGRYFNVDPVFFRLAFVVLAVGGGSGVLLYLIAWVAVPEQGKDEAIGFSSASLGTQGPVLAGVALVAVGLMLLINNLVPWFDRVMLPLVIIAAGAALLYTGGRREHR